MEQPQEKPKRSRRRRNRRANKTKREESKEPLSQQQQQQKQQQQKQKKEEKAKQAAVEADKKKEASGKEEAHDSPAKRTRKRNRGKKGGEEQQQEQQKQQAPPAKVQEKKKSVNVRPTKEELDNVALAAKKIWALDENRCNPEKEYSLNLQGGKKVFHKHDAAKDPLFKYLDKEKFFAKPTFRYFYALLDNYERSTGTSENVTHQELAENDLFLNAILETNVMKYLHNYLVAKNLSSPKLKSFKKQLHDLWFELYRREHHNDSSGFEHVFVGEEKDGKIIGFHNWIQFFLEEVKGNIDYRGYILPRRYNRHTEMPDGDEHILSLQFAWGQELKPVSTSFFGVSPEFEVALYTMMFLASGERTEVELDGVRLAIRCYKIRMRNAVRIGTSFPEVVE